MKSCNSCYYNICGTCNVHIPEVIKYKISNIGINITPEFMLLPEDPIKKEAIAYCCDYYTFEEKSTTHRL